MLRTPMKVYIAGPYSSSVFAGKEENVARAIRIAISLYKKGHNPFVPHLTHYIDLAQLSEEKLEWEDYMRTDIAWLKSADALFFIGHSRGADIELEVAKKQGLKIFYSLDEVPFILKRDRA